LVVQTSPDFVCTLPMAGPLATLQ